MKTVVIIGSSRKDGNTRKMVNYLVHDRDWDIIDLKDFTFSYYDYEHANRADDYIGLMRKIIESYDTLIFATPVYWYSMSGLMKVFFDRITDLLKIEKELGRKLRGKKMAVLSCSNGGNLGDAFWGPFSESADYLGMTYLGNVHTYEDEHNEAALDKFLESISSQQ